MCVFPSLWLSAPPWYVTPASSSPAHLYLGLPLPVFCAGPSLSPRRKRPTISPWDSPCSVWPYLWSWLLPLPDPFCLCLHCWLIPCVPNLFPDKSFAFLEPDPSQVVHLGPSLVCRRELILSGLTKYHRDNLLNKLHNNIGSFKWYITNFHMFCRKTTVEVLFLSLTDHGDVIYMPVLLRRWKLSITLLSGLLPVMFIAPVNAY